VNRPTRSLCIAVAALALGAAPAMACVNVGVYQDKPAKTLPALQKSAGKNVKTVSTYLTVGHALDPKLVALARKKGVRLLISWLPDKGKDTAKAPGFRLSAIAAGKFDPDLKLLAKQIKSLKKGAIVRPMPDPNTPWYAWSGTVNGNRPGDYVRAWKHVRKVLVKTAGKKVKLLWSVYGRSVPDNKANAISVYFPGAKQVDLVGADAYNFGNAQGLTWTTPADLFAPAYGTLQKLAKKKPFWISETGSTAKGGDKGAWIGALGQLGKTMPKLAGVVWYDVRDSTGDFRVPRSGAAAAAFKAFVRGSCK
jgi:mannan endo-1,4-beta-mannosidase